MIKFTLFQWFFDSAETFSKAWLSKIQHNSIKIDLGLLSDYLEIMIIIEIV